MTQSNIEVDPFAIVAAALNCHRESLNMESAMKRTHGWDSLGHVSVITALEEAYGVPISNDEMMSLTDMAAIVSFHERTCQAQPNDE